MLDRSLAGGLVAVTLVLGCGERSTPSATWVSSEPTPTSTPTATATPTPTATPTQTPPASPTATPTPTSLGTPSPVPAASAAALVLSATAIEPTGSAPLSRDGETVVDPAASFAVDLATAVRDARLVLLDAQEAHVPATHAREVGDTTRFSLSPAAPLVPGSRYLLRVEGATGREMRDAHGAALAPLSFAILAAGTPPAPEPKPKARPRRRR